MAAAEQYVMSEEQYTRDKRVMSHMDPETKEVHSRLEIWGAWAKDAEIRAWPSNTVLGRLIDLHPTGAAQGSKPPISMPDEIAVIDAAVCKLCDIDKKAIRLYYIKWATPETHARTMGMRVRQFQNVLRRARWRVAMRVGLL